MTSNNTIKRTCPDSLDWNDSDSFDHDDELNETPEPTNSTPCYKRAKTTDDMLHAELENKALCTSHQHFFTKLPLDPRVVAVQTEFPNGVYFTSFVDNTPGQRPFSIIHFLPRLFWATITSLRKFNGPAPAEVPRWIDIRPEKVLVGMTLGLEPITGGNAVDFISKAYEPVLMRVRVTHPFYGLFDQRGRIVKEKNMRYDPQYYQELTRLEMSLDIYTRYKADLNAQLEKFSVEMKNWRIARREWEYNLVVHEWTYGDKGIFDFDLSGVDFAELRAYVDAENEKDRAGVYGPWFVGVFSPYHDSISVSQHKLKSGLACEIIAKRFRQIDLAVEGIEKRLWKMRDRFIGDLVYPFDYEG